MQGYGEHCDLYGEYVSAFAKAGFRVFGCDRRGFGKSQGRKAKLGNSLVEDFLGYVDLVVKEHHLEKEKKFLYGFSLGGVTVTKALIDRPNYFDGIVMALPSF